MNAQEPDTYSGALNEYLESLLNYARALRELLELRAQTESKENDDAIDPGQSTLDQ